MTARSKFSYEVCLAYAQRKKAKFRLKASAESLARYFYEWGHSDADIEQDIKNVLSQEKIKDTIRKLLAHEESARKINSIAEADAFATRAKSLMKKHSIKKKDLVAKASPTPMAATVPTNIKGVWKCNCGAEFSLNVSGSPAGVNFANAILAPHTVNGHVLTKVC